MPREVKRSVIGNSFQKIPFLDVVIQRICRTIDYRSGATRCFPRRKPIIKHWQEDVLDLRPLHWRLIENDVCVQTRNSPSTTQTESTVGFIDTLFKIYGTRPEKIALGFARSAMSTRWSYTSPASNVPSMRDELLTVSRLAISYIAIAENLRTVLQQITFRSAHMVPSTYTDRRTCAYYYYYYFSIPFSRPI